MAMILHVWFDPTLVRIDPGRCLVLSEAAQGTDHFVSMFNDGLYGGEEWVPPRLLCQRYAMPK